MMGKWLAGRHEHATASDAKPWCVMRYLPNRGWPVYLQNRRESPIRYATEQAAQKAADKLNEATP